MDDREFVPNHAPGQPRPPAPKPKLTTLWMHSDRGGVDGHVPSSPRPAPYNPQPSPMPKE